MRAWCTLRRSGIDASLSAQSPESYQFQKFTRLPDEEFFEFVQAADYKYGLLESSGWGRIRYAWRLWPHIQRGREAG